MKNKKVREIYIIFSKKTNPLGTEVSKYLPKYCWLFEDTLFISTDGTSPGIKISQKDPGNERIRTWLKIPENMSAQFWKTKKLANFENFVSKPSDPLGTGVLKPFQRSI